MSQNRHLFAKTFLLVSLCLFLPFVCAEKRELTEKFNELSLTYSLRFNGIPTLIRVKGGLRKLPVNDDSLINNNNTYQFYFRAKSWLVDYKETSTFQSNYQCDIKPQLYSMYFKGLGVNLSHDLKVDATHQQAKSTTRKLEQTYHFSPDTYDPISYLLKAQCFIRAGMLEPSVKVAEEEKIITYQYKYHGKEWVKTKVGRFFAIKLEKLYEEKKKKTVYWIAEELDYYVVRFYHKQGLLSAVAILKSIEKPAKIH